MSVEKCDLQALPRWTEPEQQYIPEASEARVLERRMTLAVRIFLSVVEQRCSDRGRCLVLAYVQHHSETAERL